MFSAIVNVIKTAPNTLSDTIKAAENTKQFKRAEKATLAVATSAVEVYVD